MTKINMLSTGYLDTRFLWILEVEYSESVLLFLLSLDALLVKSFSYKTNQTKANKPNKILTKQKHDTQL